MKNLVNFFLFATFLAFTAEAFSGEGLLINLGTEGDQIAFSPVTFKHKYSKQVDIQFKNNATADSGVLHNIILYKGDLKPFLEYLQKVQYDLSKIKKYKGVLGTTVGIEPQKTQTLSVSLDAPGEYHYICTMPGHGDILEMRGKIKFE